MPGRTALAVRVPGIPEPVNPTVIRIHDARPVIDVELPPADVEDESWWSRLRKRWSWEWREFKREIKRDLGFTDG
jgi:hypothetical protein